jgi:hypothetical protein
MVSDGIERESSLAERERHDAEKAEAIRERQVRLGHNTTPAPAAVSEPEPKPKRTRARKPKS